MQFRFSVLVAVFTNYAASEASPILVKRDTDIAATSKLGQRLLSNARALANNNDEVDFSWVADYSIKFQGCHSMVQYGGEEQNDNENKLFTQRLVRFQLCPFGQCGSGTPSGCSNGAEYIVDMSEFVDAYTESKMEAQEYNCEVVRENCYCENANDDDVCESQCYEAAGLDYCIEDEDEEEFEIQRFLECQEMEMQNNGNNNNNNNGEELQYFVGPYCSADGSGIYLGVFEDETCSIAAADGTYETYNYGVTLPYSQQSLVGFDCISCHEPEDANDQNNGDQQDEDRVIEMCERLYELSGKCERKLDIDYPSNDACTFIQDIVPRLDEINSNSSGNSTAKVFAWLFAFSTLGLAAFVYHLHTKLERTTVNLSNQGGEVA